MSAIVTLAEAQAKLREIVARLTPGEEVVITENQQPVARLVGERPAPPSRPAPGLGKGSVLYMAPDFDATPEEFREYVE